MEQPFLNADARAGTIGGTVLVLLLNIQVTDMLHTALLAGIGAVVSFSVSVLLKCLIRFFRKRFF